ncbi:MAG: 16S rRNA (guanine(527)-N(7))-methyltransferase RsmG [Eubacteriaceae bacterium]|nr:16S rRNA (guanine(527)-N(7))-methyltransferase RsmG [Eubacteriaceae bacterium]
MEILKEFLVKNSIDGVDEKCDKFRKYMDGTLEWNKKVNITRITNEGDFVVKHFVDSLLPLGSDEIRDSERIIDIGTGGGFPGIPLAIVFPDKKFYLLDSSAKRLKIIDQLAKGIDITNIDIVHGRAEELARKAEYREKFDLAVSRAVANLSTLSEYCLPFVKTGGVFISYKGPTGDSELEEAAEAIRILGGQLQRVEKTEGTFGMEHQLIYIKKKKPTAKKFPRSGGKPAKDPIR